MADVELIYLENGCRICADECGGDRSREIQKRRWMDSVNVDLREKGLSGEDTKNSTVCRQLVRNIDPHTELGEEAVDEEELTNDHMSRTSAHLHYNESKVYRT